MGRHGRAFTLIELLVVISIIAVLILIFVPQIPAIMTWYRVHLSKVIMKQLEYGVDEYKRVYGDYPHDLVWWDYKLNKAMGYGDTPHLTTQGYESLYLSLQGPDGEGWGPSERFPKVKEFGPIPESPGFVARDEFDHRWDSGAGMAGAYSLKSSPRFEDPFGTPILYYKARLDTRYPDVNEDRFDLHTRYCFLVNKYAWWFQRGANEMAYGRDIVFEDKKPHAKKHWAVRLTASKDGAGNRYPYNPKSYIIWMAGADERLGYWFWSQEHSAFVPDTDPESTTDGAGICDDLLNCGR